MAASKLAALVLALGAAAPAVAAGGGEGAAPPAVDVERLPPGAVMRPPGAGDEPHPVEARLLVESSVAVPGEVVSLGVHLVQDAGWHTYWRSPGDIGLPTNIRLSLPEGAVVRPRQWVAPERFEQTGIVSYGYDREVLHIVDVELPAGLAHGSYPISAEVEWLVCETSCIPGSATVHSVLVVGGAGQHGPERPLFEHYRARTPVPLEQVEGVDVEVVACRGPVVPNSGFRSLIAVAPEPGHTVAREGADLWPTFAPTVGNDWMLAETPRVVDVEDGGFLIGIEGTSFAPDPLPADDVVGGLLRLQVDGRPVVTEVAAPLPWAPAGAEVTDADDPRCGAFASALAAAPPPVEPSPAAAPLFPPGEPAPTNVGGVFAWSFTLLAWNLVLAFVGGLILNVMPCVLPVLTLKLYGLVEQGSVAPAERRRAGLLYTAGIVASFVALAAGVWALRAFLGESVVWGYQMQYPGYVAGLATAVFLFGLSLFGVFEIPAFGMGRAHQLSSREGPAGYFFTGVFATLVATPCSAPFLGTATAFAFQAPTPLLFLVFVAVGLGLAAPFLLVAYVPRVYALMPRPGAWMETFKQFLGFTLVATTLWLVSVLFGLVGEERGLGFLAFLSVVAFGAWIFGRFGGVAADGRRQLLSLGAGLLVSWVGATLFLDLALAAPDRSAAAEPLRTELAFDAGIPWQAFSPERVQALEGRVVFIDFTADWCVTCKVNERTVLDTSAVRGAMDDLDVVPLVADFTRKDPVISDWLARYERAGVPLYLVIPPSGVDDAIVLPEVITQGMVIDALERASQQVVGMR